MRGMSLKHDKLQARGRSSAPARRSTVRPPAPLEDTFWTKYSDGVINPP
jgi:hypothetical protein